MFNSGILDVAAGLVFLYLLLSLICSAMNELIEAKLRMRAKDLEQGLRELLYDLDGTGLVKKLYEHPLVFGPYQTRSPSCNFVVAEKPSYIPARNFALALMDIISPARGSAISGAAFATVLPSSLSVTQTAASSSLRQAIAQPATENPLSQDQNIQQALLALVDAAGNDINQARENIEDWFNSAMDQVSGWYKRRSQRIILALGLFLAIVVNADTITIARSLSMDTAMRGSLVAAAAEYMNKSAAQPADPKTKFDENVKQLYKLSLPLGWVADDPRSIPDKFESWVLKLFGWLLTTMAISVGAPFWFDLLNKFINIRSALKPLEKTSGT